MGGAEAAMAAMALAGGAQAVLLALLLSAARPLAFLFVMPLFTRFGLQEGVVRGGIVMAFAAPIVPGVAMALGTEPLPVPMAAMLIAKELLIGLVLALILGLPLWAVVTAGDLIDMQRGASMATLVEPGSGEDTTITGTLFFLLAALVLVSSGWFTEVVLSALYATYDDWPVLALLPPPDPRVAEGFLDLLDALLETGLVLSIPIFAPLLTAEIALALSGKYTQQLNVMFLAMSLKQVIYVLLLPVYFGTLMIYLQDEIASLGAAEGALRGFLDPSAAP